MLGAGTVRRQAMLARERDAAITMGNDVAAMRRDYRQDALDETMAAADPLHQFDRWFQHVRQTDTHEANSMVLATVDQHGVPSARTVLLKGYDQRGLVFYTNYDSRKGRNISQNPAVALVFNWPTLERQVRIEGIANRVSAEESDAYFGSRPLGSQIGAAASPQSEPVPDRGFLETRFEQMEQGSHLIQRPGNWGGYRVEPSMFEFWQGRPNRLHDRLRYDRIGDRWEIVRLAP